MIKVLQALALALAIVCVGCHEKKAAACPYNKSKGTAAGSACRMQPDARANAAQGFNGVVMETMNALNYTYVFVDTGKGKVWAVGPQFAVKPSDTVSIAGLMPMPNFHSKTLNRTFDFIFFAGSITQGKQVLQPQCAPGKGG